MVKEGIKLTCKRCGYTWIYRGNSMYWTSCPRCRANVKIETSSTG